VRLDRRLGRAPTRAERAAGSHVHPVPHCSRRRFLQLAAGATTVGAVGGAALLRSAAAGADAPRLSQVEPIPTTVEFFPGVESHVQAPPFLQGPDSDPSTVYNFRGASAIGFIDGEVERRNRRTGETRVLPFVASDMRFMQGEFRGNDGRVRPATFAFI